MGFFQVRSDFIAERHLGGLVRLMAPDRERDVLGVRAAYHPAADKRQHRGNARDPEYQCPFHIMPPPSPPGFCGLSDAAG